MTAAPPAGARNGTSDNQVLDDLDLLELMLADLRVAPELYRPGNYWANYERMLVPELRTAGLLDFRRRQSSILNTFGASDLAPITAATNVHPTRPASSLRLRAKRLLLDAARRVRPASRVLGALGGSYVGASADGVRRLSYELAAAYGRGSGAAPLDSLDASTAGNPEDVFRVDGRTYTTSILQYYLLYAYCCHFMRFDAISTVMELGSGMGKQVEVIRKLHPHLSFILFDIPPQLYVCERYLDTVFPGDVVSYRETREMTALPALEPGKIYIFGTWKLPELSGLSCDLFWNAASFQEMEPSLVLNYLELVSRMTGRYVFLQQSMHGMQQAARPGDHGVLERTTMAHYRQGLADFDLVDVRPSIDFEFLRHATESPYSVAFWRRAGVE